MTTVGQVDVVCTVSMMMLMYMVLTMNVSRDVLADREMREWMMSGKCADAVVAAGTVGRWRRWSSGRVGHEDREQRERVAGRIRPAAGGEGK
jgi:hypothetical protein